MSSHEPDQHEPVDLLIGRALKGWVAQFPPPAAARQELLDEVVQVRRRKSSPSHLLHVLLRGLQAAITTGPLFEPEFRSNSMNSTGMTYYNIRMMHISVLHVNTLRLGMFSMFI